MAVSRSLFVSPDRRQAPRQATGAVARFEAVLHEGFDEAAPSWLTLQSEGVCLVYQRLDWVAGIVATLMPAGKAVPVVVEIRDVERDVPVMVLPFARCRRFGHSVLTWLDLGVCDYAAPLVAAGFAPSEPQLAAIWASVLRVLPRADLVSIQRIPAHLGGIANPLASLPDLRRMDMVAHGLPIDGPPETLLKRICSPSTNQKFRKAERRLAREGEVRFVVAEDAATAEVIFAALLEQRRQRFRDLGRFDLLDRADVRDFYEQAARAGLSGGPARLFGLSVDGRWIATALGLVHDGAFHGILLAMDSGWRQFSPGLRIVTEIMTWARRNEIGYFDFTIGDLPYKAEFGARSRPLLELAVARSLRGILALWCIRSAARLEAEMRARRALFEKLRRGRQWLRRWTRVVPVFRNGR